MLLYLVCLVVAGYYKFNLQVYTLVNIYHFLVKYNFCILPISNIWIIFLESIVNKIYEYVCVCMGHILYSFSHKFYFPVRLSSCKFNFVNFMKLGQRLIESL